MTFTELLNEYRATGPSQVETRTVHIDSFRNWAYQRGYSLVVKRSPDAINRELTEATAQRDEAEERIAQLKKELEQ